MKGLWISDGSSQARAIQNLQRPLRLMARATIQRRASLRRVARATRRFVRFVRFVQIGQRRTGQPPGNCPGLPQRSTLAPKKEMGLRPGGKVGVPFEARPIPASEDEDEPCSLYWGTTDTRSRPRAPNVFPASSTHTNKGNYPETLGAT